MKKPIRIELRPAPISPPPGAVDPSCGAVCTFRGVTRAETHPEFGVLEALEYEVHEAMARSQLERLAEAILEEFAIEALVVVHAVGRVPVGEPSVHVEVTAGHRDAAFGACRAMIDRLKERVPIFKVECWAGGRTRPEGVQPSPDPTSRED